MKSRFAPPEERSHQGKVVGNKGRILHNIRDGERAPVPVDREVIEVEGMVLDMLSNPKKHRIVEVKCFVDKRKKANEDTTSNGKAISPSPGLSAFSGRAGILLGQMFPPSA